MWTACRGTSVIPALHTEVRPWGWSHNPPPVLSPSLGQGPAILPAGLISVALAFFLHLSLICPCPSVHRKRFPRCCRDHTVGIKSGDGGWCSWTVPNALHSRSHLILSTTQGIKHYYNPHSQTRELGSGKGRNSLLVTFVTFTCSPLARTGHMDLPHCTGAGKFGSTHKYGECQLCICDLNFFIFTFPLVKFHSTHRMVVKMK